MAPKRRAYSYVPAVFTGGKGFAPSFATKGVEKTAGGTFVANSILRYPRSASIIVFAGVTRGVEYGLIAAGITVAVIAVIQSCSVVLGWIHSS
jgi:hypothetical protein